MKKFKLINAAIVALMVSATAHAGTWRFALEEALIDPQGIFATKFKEYVEENSEHKVLIFPYGTLGESTDTMEQTQAGVLQFNIQSPGFTGALIPEAQAFFLPYILPENDKALDHFFRNSKAISEDFKGLYKEKELELLQMFPQGQMAMTTQKEIHSPEDLAGVKFRVMTNPLLVETYKAFGASPTPLPWGEVYGGLQTKMIQGQENPPSFVYTSKLYEVTDVITMAGHSNYIAAVMAGGDFYDNLPGNDKKLVKDGIAFAYDYIMEYQDGLQEKAIKKIIAAKPQMKINFLSNEQRAPFRERAKQVKRAFVDMTGESGKKILEKMEKDLKASIDATK